MTPDFFCNGGHRRPERLRANVPGKPHCFACCAKRIAISLGLRDRLGHRYAHATTYNATRKRYAAGRFSADKISKENI